MREDQPCKVLCRIVLGAEAAKNFKEKIDGNYRVNLYVESLDSTSFFWMILAIYISLSNRRVILEVLFIDKNIVWIFCKVLALRLGLQINCFFFLFLVSCKSVIFFFDWQKISFCWQQKLLCKPAFFVAAFDICFLDSSSVKARDTNLVNRV